MCNQGFLKLLNRQIRESKRIIQTSLELYPNAKKYIALSFGKDSLVMWDIIKEINPSIPCFFYHVDYTKDFYNFGELIEYYGPQMNLTTKDVTQILKQNKKNTHELFKLILPNKDLAFVGLRREESKARRLHIDRFGTIFLRKDNKVNVYPLANWRTTHIEMYIKTKNLKVLSKYEKLGFGERTTAKIPSHMEEEELEKLKSVDITSYNKIRKALFNS